MKRREAIKNILLAAATLPFVGKLFDRNPQPLDITLLDRNGKVVLQYKLNDFWVDAKPIIKTSYES